MAGRVNSRRPRRLPRELISARGNLAQFLRERCKEGSATLWTRATLHTASGESPPKRQGCPCPDIIYYLLYIYKIIEEEPSSSGVKGSETPNNISEYRHTDFTNFKIISAQSAPIFADIILGVRSLQGR
jgi:hypothetical protein